MRKTLVSLALGSALCAPALAQQQLETPPQAQSPHTFSANVGLYSNYIFRGISQTSGEPALQGGFDYGHSSGFYLGTWASNVSWLEDFGGYTRSSLEWDFYGGYRGAIGKSDFTFDLGTVYYYFPGDKNPGVADADTWEIYAGLGWKFLGVKYYYNLEDYFGAQPTGRKTDGTWYLDLYADYPLGNSGFSLFGHYGILDVDNDGSGANEASYDDWKIGVKYVVPSGMLKDVNLGAFYTDNDASRFYVDANGYNTAKDAFVVYVSKSF
ncbi:MAG: TorF family putative porin [Burkholderiales bacterium]|nr:TorF family putative porin [Burkholderiales bacterium]